MRVLNKNNVKVVLVFVPTKKYLGQYSSTISFEILVSLNNRLKLINRKYNRNIFFNLEIRKFLITVWWTSCFFSEWKKHFTFSLSFTPDISPCDLIILVIANEPQETYFVE